MAAPRKPEVRLLVKGDTLKQVKALVDPLLLTDSDISRITRTLVDEMQLGLSRDPARRKKTSLMMECTYVRTLLDGSENGDYLALDLGGTNFRVLLIRFKDGKCESISKNYNLSNKTLSGPASGVFDHLADSIYKFMSEQKILNKKLPLGFTFSFPMTHKSLKSGILTTWTKSFTCPDGAGEDAVKMLEDAIRKRGDIQVEVVAILNDTTGTLMAGSYLDHNCRIGLILGTGCNAAFMEDLKKVDKWEGDTKQPRQVVINTEWGAFGDNGSLDFVKTQYDKVLDLHYHPRGQFSFEKLFSGHYVGDIVRLIMLKLANEKLLFKGHVSPKLQQWRSVKASHMSNVERDCDDCQKHTERLVHDLDLDDHVTPQDLSVIRYLCSAVSIRTAQLVSACISVLLNHLKKPENTVAIDGSLYKYHPRLHSMMTAWIRELAPTVQAKLIVAEDGSGRGAGFVAAVAKPKN